jgi:hypothetical protein
LAEEEANAAIADASGAIEYARFAVLNAAVARRATNSDSFR